jgi:hypothetical protein
MRRYIVGEDPGMRGTSGGEMGHSWNGPNLSIVGCPEGGTCGAPKS